MIRNLRVLTVAAALAALGAFSASAAQAHTPAQFHCSVEPCQVTMKPDGTGTTAHHVVVVKSEKGETFSTTCSKVTGEGTLATKTSNQLTISNIKGESCKINGVEATLNSNGCHYLLSAAGTLTITCPPGKEIENTGFIGECSYNIAPQGPLPGVTFHNLGGGELTGSMKVALAVTTSAGCPFVGYQAEFTTSNFILTSETDPGGVMANFSWTSTVA